MNYRIYVPHPQPFPKQGREHCIFYSDKADQRAEPFRQLAKRVGWGKLEANQ